MHIELERPPTKEYTTRDNCRSCDSQLTEVLPFGEVALPEWGAKDKVPTKVPMTLCVCEACTLVQLKETTNSELLWNENYGYRSGINESMVAHLDGIVDEVERTVHIKPNDYVIDIGANDGTLLSKYRTGRAVGFDPSRNMQGYFYDNMRGTGRDFTLYLDFFKKEPFLRENDQKAKAVTAISMFYDLEDPNKFLEDVNAVLDDEGIFVVQQNYLPTMLTNNAFDNIVHEHLEYYSLNSMENLLDRHNMEVFDAEVNDLNGGSLRTYIRKEGSSVMREGGKVRVETLREQESALDITNPQTYHDFAKRVEQNGKLLEGYLKLSYYAGKNIYVYGASTRGNTLLQGYGIDSRIIKGAAERNPDKYGKYTVGTNIPIVSEEEARKDADIFLVLPWFFKDNFMAREKEFIKNGGELVIPLPEMEIINGR